MTSPYIAEFISLATIHFLAVVAPGPDFAVTVSQSVRYGRRIGIFTAIGIGCGISVHVGYTLLGVGALLHASNNLIVAAKIIGGAYLLYLAINLLKAKPAQAPGNDSTKEEDKTACQPTNYQSFRVGFFTNATNPKATLFFMAIFTTLVSNSTPISIQITYGAWMCSVNALWFVIVSLIFSQETIRKKFLRIGHWFERTMGAAIAIFAAKLIMSI